MKQQFPRIAMGLGIVLALVLFRFSPGSGGTELPMLTALFIAEFGFLICIGSAIYSGLEIRRVGAGRVLVSQLLGNAILVLLFLGLGLRAWSQAAAGA